MSQGGRRGAAGRAAALRRAPSDSDCSAETASLSADSAEPAPLAPRAPPPPPRGAKARARRRGSEWEVLEGLKDGQRFEQRPDVFNGYLHKKRKWPLKGWHKRFFVVDGGILVYARSGADVARGRLHGSVDVGLSVISAKVRRRRIDIDADEFIYHLRAKTPEIFRTWLNVLKTHRLYRQHLLTFGAREPLPSLRAAAEDAPPADVPSDQPGSGLEGAARALGQAQLSVQQLQRLLHALHLQQQLLHDTDVSLEGASPSVKKDRRKFGLRKKKSSSKCASVELQPAHLDVSGSHSTLPGLTAPPSPAAHAHAHTHAHAHAASAPASLPFACAAARPQSLPAAEPGAAGAPGTGPSSLGGLTPEQRLREDFAVLAKDLLASLKGVVATLACERGRLRDAAGPQAAPAALLAALRTDLSSALHHNSELRSRLSRIHDASDLAEICAGRESDAAGALAGAGAPSGRFPQSPSLSSSCVSASEFFDAEELAGEERPHDECPTLTRRPPPQAGVIELDGDSSSEAGSLSSEDGSASSDNSEPPAGEAEAEAEGGGEAGAGARQWTRRTRLPAPRASAGGPSLWNLLCKNIGKDLSQVSMPVSLNEPLNMLQRLCEELEHSALLDAAASAAEPRERAALVAAFAVSAYAAAAHRAASKPFNPLLGETFELAREDRGFRFVAEQVSHHPPVSACHAQSPRWLFWQEARIRTKFWGKSMEFQPAGRVHVRLLPAGDHYSWNKVTTCVHNLFGGQRWVDQYGDMLLVCRDTDYTCKLNFVKASSWSSGRHEVRGTVSSGDGSSRLRLSGRWSEALYAGEPPAERCLWRPGPMPPDHELYYGFTRFAMELNEMEPGMAERLPPTDTRLRPDQRALEEGDVDAAEALKLRLEQAQRERRRTPQPHEPAWFRKAVVDGEEMWVFTGEYWGEREAGFPRLAAAPLW